MKPWRSATVHAGKDDDDREARRLAQAELRIEEIGAEARRPRTVHRLGDRAVKLGGFEHMDRPRSIVHAAA